MKESMMVVGQRVKLNFYPHCEGVIIELQAPLVVGVQLTYVKAKVRWDNPEDGTSDWLSPNDLTAL